MANRIQVTSQNTDIDLLRTSDPDYNDKYNELNRLFRITRKDKNLEVKNNQSIIYTICMKETEKIVGFCVITFNLKDVRQVLMESLCADTNYKGILPRLLNYLIGFKMIHIINLKVYGGILENGIYIHDRYHAGLKKYYEGLGFKTIRAEYDVRGNRFYQMEFKCLQNQKCIPQLFLPQLH